MNQILINNKKLVSIGTSTGLVIEKPFLKQIEVKRGDSVDIIIRKRVINNE